MPETNPLHLQNDLLHSTCAVSNLWLCKCKIKSNEAEIYMAGRGCRIIKRGQHDRIRREHVRSTQGGGPADTTKKKGLQQKNAVTPLNFGAGTRI